MQDKSLWPNEGELVVGTVKKVLDFGAFVELDEYSGQEGMIHLSEVASGWIKHIRDYVREGQKVVCKVLRVDPARKHIDLSLKDVNQYQRKAKIQEWKITLRAEKWISFVQNNLKLSDEETQNLRKELIENYGGLYQAFEEIASQDIDDVKLDERYRDEVYRVAQENIKHPKVEISGFLDLTCFREDGVDMIKKALKSALKAKKKDTELNITYVGAPRFRLHVVAGDYKRAEAILKDAAERAIKEIKKLGGKGEFHRHES
ncbi:MAG: translation initiation factor IF-2 subunit alpha [Candidatus Syntrophoarchaeum caldarius]|uniref:Translation initiation factor 2 subunit alpha n=1 Tax=Candidatus Syntropharchaeum caldarium TaxID=1838285 RepID=A0A1F2PA38_9EURY|nr:MAG: translation initiation factor IF-2 subunit alpha [Candidatus Syntrophoarchaeum caldarius]